MQPSHWDHLRTFECVCRLGSLTAAARALGLSQSTVSRQITRLEAEAGAPLILRGASARPSERGAALLTAVRPMVAAALAAQAALADEPELRGVVTVASVGEVVRWVLCDALPGFCRAHPGLTLRLLAGNHVSNLAADEADVALRFARPTRGDLVSRRLAAIRYGYFVAAGASAGAATPWLGLAGSLARIPEQRVAERVFAGRPPRLLLEDVEVLARAVAAGLGVAILPRGVGGRVPGLMEVAPEQVGAPAGDAAPARELWLVVHRSKQRVPKIRAVMRWLQGLPWSL